jgi:hypothetical protein
MTSLISSVTLEPLLTELIARQIEKLASAHPGESFYGFAVDTNIAFGQVYVSANTRTALRDHCAKVYGGGSPDPEQEEELQWQFGDWTYRCFNRGDAHWDAHWDPMAMQIAELSEQLSDEDRDDEWDAWKEDFLRSVCRVLLDLESGNGFVALRRDDDFRVCAADHDEAVERGEIRMDKVRAATHGA